MKISVLFTGFVLGAFISFGQNVFVSPDDFKSRIQNPERFAASVSNIKSGLRIYGGDVSGKIKIVERDGSIKTFEKKSIWGYEKNHKFYRIAPDGDSFKIVDTGVVYVYEKPILYWSAFYISLGPEGKMYRLRKRNLLQIFENKACLNTALKKMEQDGFSLRKRNEREGKYVMNLYLEKYSCLK